MLRYIYFFIIINDRIDTHYLQAKTRESLQLFLMLSSKQKTL